ncbi:hypothetical protein MUP77_21710 [Candidatus Bathyarchaeota archaeon]|nr:hypothetical protein [Candidatus Bathyarchaeota archaeon]
MTIYLDEDEYFSMNAYVQALGDQTIALSGYLVEHRSDGTYVAPLIPDLFYGVNGTQLSHSWRQNFTATGDQTILSRSGGEPSVPRNELYWRKISNNGQMKKEEVQLVEEPAPLPNWVIPVGILGAIVGGYLLYRTFK